MKIVITVTIITEMGGEVELIWRLRLRKKLKKFLVFIFLNRLFLFTYLRWMLFQIRVVFIWVG